MADLITIKSGALGSRTEMPKLSVDELGYCTDEEALYIGTDAGNKRLCGVKDKVSIIAQIDALSARIDEIIARLDAPSE